MTEPGELWPALGPLAGEPRFDSDESCPACEFRPIGGRCVCRGRRPAAQPVTDHPEVVCAALPVLSMAAVAAWVVTGTTPVDTAGWVVALVTGWAR